MKKMFGCGYDKTDAYKKELYEYRTGRKGCKIESYYE